MKRTALTLFVVHALACLSTAQVAESQWRFSKRNANGTYSDYGLTAVNGQAIGFTGGVPSMLTLSTAAWGSITGTLSSQTDLQTALDAKLATNTAASTYQPLDSDLTAIAALTTTSYGRELLTRADAAATRSALGLGTLATQSATISDYLTLATAASTYQPLDSGLTALAGLADASGVLTNNGSGSLSYTATSTGGSFTSDSGKIARYGTFGELNATMVFQVYGPGGVGSYPTTSISANSLTIAQSASNFISLNAATVTGGKYIKLPAIGTEETPATLITDLDTGTVTSAMLAGSIAISKLSTTGTASSSTYLRGDGAWTAIDLSGYLPLSGGTLTGALVLPNGTAALPALTGGDLDSGVYFPAVNQVGFSTNGILRWFIDSSGTLQGSTNSLQLGGNTIGVNFFARGGSYFIGASDNLILSNDAAARLQLGSDSATPISQQIKTADGSGTNIAASNLTLGGSLSTGSGAGGDVITVTSMSGSSGSSANATQERSRIIGRFVNLTEGTATNIASIALASGRVTGGTATLTVWASDGTDHQALTTEIRFGAINKAGTVTATCTQTDGTTAASTGTLTVTYDAIASGNNVVLRANAVSSLTQTILRSRLVITALNGDDTQVVTPQ